jgi:hypothetical protein
MPTETAANQPPEHTSAPSAAAGSTSSDRPPLSMTQIMASVLAAVSATVAASYFGVAGTVVGAGLGSAISVVGGALYKHYMDRTRDRIKAAAIESAVAQRFGITDPAVHAANAAAAASDTTALPRVPGRGVQFNTKRILIATAALFVLVLGAVTAFEALSGKPLSATVKNQKGTGTSLIGGHTSSGQSASASSAQTSHSTSPTSTATNGAPATAGSTSSSGPTTTVTVTQSPTATPTPTPTVSGATGSATAPANAGTPTILPSP